MIDLRDYLTPDQQWDYQDYLGVRAHASFLGTSHLQRIEASHEQIQPVTVEHCIPYSPPYDLDAPVAVLHPSPRFVAELMAGGIHPPIDAVHEQKLLIFGDTKAEVVRAVDAPEWKARNGYRTEIVVDSRRAHLEVEGPLTYEQAIEYCLMKDVPKKVWEGERLGRKSNRPKFWIARRDAMPATRTYRDAWELNDVPAFAAAA